MSACICMCVYLIYILYVTLPWRSQAGEVLSLRCTVLWRCLIQLSSCHMLQEHTHCHFPERAPTIHTNTPQPYEPHLFLFPPPPLVCLPLFACLGSALIFLDTSAHQTHWKLQQCPDATHCSAGRAVTLHHCVPP